MTMCLVALSGGNFDYRTSESQLSYEPPPMFVLVSFDATPRGGEAEGEYRFAAMFDRIRKAAPHDFVGKKPSFTLFLNTGLLQLRKTWSPPPKSRWVGTDHWRHLVKNPALPKGRVIGHAWSPDAISGAVASLKQMHADGIELGSHGVQHFSGRGWTKKQWQSEFREHARILALHGLPKPVGYRAPFLETSKPGFASDSDPLFQVMEEHGMRYDSSKAGRLQPRWPTRIGKTDIWELELPMYQHPKKGPVILFGKSRTNKWHIMHALKQQFDLRYNTNRAPLVLGGHGEFSEEIEKFLTTACFRPGVRCGTYREFVHFMDRHPELEGAERLPQI